MFHPPMAHGAIHSSRTFRKLNWLDLVRKVPIRTFLRLILVLRRLPPVVLNIMGVRTFSSVMAKLISSLLLGVRTPHCFVNTDDIIWVFVVWVYEWNQDLFLCVCKRAEIMILAEHGIFVEVLAELGFIASGVVQLFDFIVRPLAVTVRFLAWNMTIVVEIGSPPIFFVVEAQTSFPLVAV